MRLFLSCILALFLTTAATALPMVPPDWQTPRHGPWSRKQPPAYPMPDIGSQDAPYDWQDLDYFHNRQWLYGRRRYERKREKMLWELYREHPDEPPPRWKVDQARRELSEWSEMYVKNAQAATQRRGENARIARAEKQKQQRGGKPTAQQAAETAVQRTAAREVQKARDRQANPAIGEIERQLATLHRERNRLYAKLYRTKSTDEARQVELRAARARVARAKSTRRGKLPEGTIEGDQLTRARAEVHRLEKLIQDGRYDERRLRTLRAQIKRLTKQRAVEIEKARAAAQDGVGAVQEDDDDDDDDAATHPSLKTSTNPTTTDQKTPPPAPNQQQFTSKSTSPPPTRLSSSTKSPFTSTVIHTNDNNNKVAGSPPLDTPSWWANARRAGSMALNRAAAAATAAGNGAGGLLGRTAVPPPVVGIVS